MKKSLTAVFLAVALIFSLCACSANEKDNDAAAEQNRIETQEQMQSATQNQSVDEGGVTQNTADSFQNNPDYELPEEKAKEIAYEALVQECKSKTFSDNINNFTFDSIKRCDIREPYGAFNRGNDISTYNKSSHPYYAVRYNDASLSGSYAYFCIDLRTGDLLYSGYMGD